MTSIGRPRLERRGLERGEPVGLGLVAIQLVPQEAQHARGALAHQRLDVVIFGRRQAL